MIIYRVGEGKREVRLCCINFLDALNNSVWDNPIYHGLQKDNIAHISFPCCHKMIANLLPCLIFIIIRGNGHKILNLLLCLIFTSIRRNGQESYYFYQ